MPYTGTPRTWVAGEVPTATHFNDNLRDFARGFTDAWTSYTPTLTASTTNPTNWTRTGYYMQVGKLVVCRFILTAGGSMTAGSGNYRVALPVNANVAAGDVPGPAQVTLYDASTGARGNPVVALSNTAYIEFRYPSTWPTGASTAVAHNAPWTWASGDLIICGLMYEAA